MEDKAQRAARDREKYFKRYGRYPSPLYGVKYTEETLAPVVAASFSYREVAVALGRRPSGGTQSHLRSRVRLFNIDASHFRRRGTRITPRTKSVGERFVLLPPGSNRVRGSILSAALISDEVPYACSCCGVGETWNGAALTLDVDHVDGNYLNNLKENLRFLCPNCHSQQVTSKPWRFTSSKANPK